VNQTQRNWREALELYLTPKVLWLLFLGFSAGLPYLLVFSTLSTWLSQSGVSKASIGFFAWVGITYSVKVFWAPVVDRLTLPMLTRLLGQRRSWMLLAQCGIAISLFVMQGFDPQAQLFEIAVSSVAVAFCSATQDIVIDAFRIESAGDEYQGAMSATYLLGYRVALLVSGAGALWLSGIYSWDVAYISMTALVGVGIVTTLLVREPEKKEQNSEGNRSFFRSVLSSYYLSIGDFFKRYGRQALLILSLVACYRLSDIAMGIMANPFYLDLGFTTIEIAKVSKLFGFAMTILGAGLGGLVVARYGVQRPLVFGALSVAVTNLLFAKLSLIGADITWFTVAVVADNLCGGFAVAVFIAYLSSLTSETYTATQYALFSSIMTLPAKFISGFAGVAVESYGYTVFFVGVAALGLPAILMSLWANKFRR